MQRLDQILAAPHRGPFLAGATGVGGLALWWLIQLVALRTGTLLLPETGIPPALLHGPAMLYAGFAPFIFGFLLTVFPRWMGQADLERGQFGPVAIALVTGVLTVQGGLWSGTDRLVLAGFLLLAAGWGFAVYVLARVLRRNAISGRPRCWHAWSALAALVIGLTGLFCAAGFLATGDAALVVFANRLGISGLLLPVFLTVAHRMVPFFAGNVVQGYVIWRPEWLLALLWALLVTRITGELLQIGPLATAANAALAATTALMCWKWCPRSTAPGLLQVLIWGFAWAPVGFALAAVESSLEIYSRGPDHALLIGFSGSLLIAMVTRVTQGHSGRPLAMPLVAWVAFAGMQAAAASRILAAERGEDLTFLLLAGSVFAAGLLPWVLRNARIYLSARVDGRPG